MDEVLPGPSAHVGGVLRAVETRYPSEGSSVDPAMSAGFSQWQMLSLTNDGLVTYRRVGGLAGSTLVPDLATSLPAPTDNGRTYTFQLRSRIHYSDGTLVEPQDLLHEFVRVYRLGNEYAESLESDIVGAKRCMLAPRRCTFAGGIVANDQANTITFHLTRPGPPTFSTSSRSRGPTRCRARPRFAISADPSRQPPDRT